MPRRLSDRSASSLAAPAVLGLSALAAGVALARAVRLDPIPAAAPARGAPAAPEGGRVPADPSAVALPRSLAARAAAGDVDNDPFSPDRQLPVEEAEVQAEPAGEPSRPAAEPEVVRLLGTVLLPGGGGFAIYELPGDVPRTVRIGETVRGLTLVAVEPGRAIFRAANGARVELLLSKTGT